MLVLNIGGISNISVLPAQGPVIGFDCGPGNALMDYWCQQHTGAPYDAQGRWAAQGTVHPALLETFLKEPFFQKAPPKKHRKGLVQCGVAQQQVAALCGTAPRRCTKATLTELTAQACANTVKQYGGAQL